MPKALPRAARGSLPLLLRQGDKKGSKYGRSGAYRAECAGRYPLSRLYPMVHLLLNAGYVITGVQPQKRNQIEIEVINMQGIPGGKPRLELGIDEFTLTLQPTKEIPSLDGWVQITDEMVETFERKARLEEFFGKLVIATNHKLQGYDNGREVDREFCLAIGWHDYQPKMGVCVRFSAQAWRAYQMAYKAATGDDITLPDFLRMVQDACYTFRLTRVDLTADYFDYPDITYTGDFLKVDSIYNAIKRGQIVVKDCQNRQRLKTGSMSALDKGGAYETCYIGSRKGKTNGFLRVYDKRKEQLKDCGNYYDKANACESWIRFEAVYRHQYAALVGEELLKVQTPEELCQLIAKYITDRYRFIDAETELEEDFTAELLEIANGCKAAALFCRAPRDNSFRRSVKHLELGSGLFSALYKADVLWPDGARVLLGYLYRRYKDDYAPEAGNKSDIRNWLKKHWNLRKVDLNDVLYLGIEVATDEGQRESEDTGETEPDD